MTKTIEWDFEMMACSRINTLVRREAAHDDHFIDALIGTYFFFGGGGLHANSDCIADRLK